MFVVLNFVFVLFRGREVLCLDFFPELPCSSFFTFNYADDYEAVASEWTHLIFTSDATNVNSGITIFTRMELWTHFGCEVYRVPQVRAPAQSLLVNNISGIQTVTLPVLPLIVASRFVFPAVLYV